MELVATIDELFSIEARAREGRFDAQQRLALRQAEAGPWLEKIKTLALEARKAVRREPVHGLQRLSRRSKPAGDSRFGHATTLMSSYQALLTC